MSRLRKKLQKIANGEPLRVTEYVNASNGPGSNASNVFVFNTDPTNVFESDGQKLKPEAIQACLDYVEQHKDDNDFLEQAFSYYDIELDDTSWTGDDEDFEELPMIDKLKYVNDFDLKQVFTEFLSGPEGYQEVRVQ
ncbi:hypothetical protein D3C81_384600 [compost metagenome]